MKFDVTQRVAGTLALIFAAYFVAHTIHRAHSTSAPDSPKIPMSQRASMVLSTIDFIRPADAPLPDVPLVADRPFILDLTFLSKGSLSADKLAMVVRIGIASSATEQADQNRLWEKVREQADKLPPGVNSLYPGKEALIAVQYPQPKNSDSDAPITQADIEQIKAGTKSIVLAVIVKYTDEYGPIETQHCQSYAGVSWRVWRDCYGHNQIIPVKEQYDERGLAHLRGG